MSTHRRQFVIAPEPLLSDVSWSSRELEDGLHLSYHEALPVAATHDRDGAPWTLLGIAIQSDPRYPAPLEEIAASRTDEVDALTANWSGRWVLIGGGLLRADAGGVLACFHGRRPDGSLVISSSAPLLSYHVPSREAAPPLRYAAGDAYPAPASRFPGVDLLLPSQALALRGHDEHPVRHRRLLADQPDETYEEILEYLDVSLRTVLRNLSVAGRPLWLALTGGRDSRVLLAALLREGIDFTTFTFEWAGMSAADRRLPPLLAKDAGVPHRWIQRRDFDERLVRAFDEHTGFCATDRDREMYAWGQWAQVPADAIVLRAGVFALGALHYHQRLPAHRASIPESVARVFGFTEHYRNSRPHHEGIRRWADWVRIHPEQAMDWRDRFYWEQRIATWMATLEHELDIVEAEIVNPLNCRSIMAAMLRIDPHKRYGKRWEVDLTYRLAPFATDHPYHLAGRPSVRMRRAAADLLHHPHRRRLVLGRLRALAARTFAVWPGLFLAHLAFKVPLLRAA